MAVRQFAYGLAAIAALVGGISIYNAIPPTPDPYVTGDDVVELMEGVNERWAAVTRHTVTNGRYNFAAFTNLGESVQLAQMRQVMTNVNRLAPYFVREISNGIPIMHTRKTIHQLAGIGLGDGTNWTVGIATNGTSVYGDAPPGTLCTNLLWECYRGLAVMTQSVPEVFWGRGNYWPDITSTAPLWSQFIHPDPPTPANLFTNTTMYWFFYAEGPLESRPAWYTSTNFFDVPGMSLEYLKTATLEFPYQDLPHYSTNTFAPAGAAGRELLTFAKRATNKYLGDTEAGYYPMAWVWSTLPAVSRFCPTGEVYVYGMDTGVVAAVSARLEFNGHVDYRDPINNTQCVLQLTCFDTTNATFTCDGVGTGVFGRVLYDTEVNRAWDRFPELAGIQGYTGTVITATFTNVMRPTITWEFSRCPLR